MGKEEEEQAERSKHTDKERGAQREAPTPTSQGCLPPGASTPRVLPLWARAARLQSSRQQAFSEGFYPKRMKLVLVQSGDEKLRLGFKLHSRVDVLNATDLYT